MTEPENRMEIPLRIDPERAGTYFTLPFQVPDEVERMTIEYRYPRHVFEKIIDSQINDGLLHNAPLTFKDIDTVKATFIDKLKTMYHTRISYPELK